MIAWWFSTFEDLNDLRKQVELSIRANEMFIGTVLKALEVEDLVCRKGMSEPCYLARSFIQSTYEPFITNATEDHSFGSSEKNQSEGDDRFYEVSENLNDPVDSPMQSAENFFTPHSRSSEKSNLKPPSFTRVAGLLPDDLTQTGSDPLEVTDTLDSFVKAQIIFYDQNSSLYDNIDKRVSTFPRSRFCSHFLLE